MGANADPTPGSRSPPASRAPAHSAHAATPAHAADVRTRPAIVDISLAEAADCRMLASLNSPPIPCARRPLHYDGTEPDPGFPASRVGPDALRDGRRAERSSIRHPVVTCGTIELSLL
ncbi:hypothetical protein Arub01_36690 [Actinomadura rubrobrunea]|uniref:Uncharacterized protein n=1 Tax=Actinomadura rubrobrunea TaxID=115335 RepID=A0A9W6PVY6_9ACTN|nr:hypothetical protein Arub01_36690 [Actinomadura rubrobrunea]